MDRFTSVISGWHSRGWFFGRNRYFWRFYTIQFTREGDTKKERHSIQPFLNIKITAKPIAGEVKQFNIVDEFKYVDGKAEQLFYPIYLSISNIGNGFVNTLIFGTEENITWISYKEVFAINETKMICLNV